MSKRKGQRKKRARALKAGLPVLNPNTHADAGGIDIGSTELVAAVPPDRDAAPVRTFTAFTSGVYAVRDWLLACGIKTVAIESTGNYWITVYDVLEEAGIDVWLVNARAVKGVPGKKTDVCDAQWLQQLHAAGCSRNRTARKRRSSRCVTSCGTAPTSSRRPASKCS